MIDIDLFRKTLTDDDGYIEFGDTIPIELFELMCISKTERVKSLFKKTNGYSRGNHTFFVQQKCAKCNEIDTLEMGKSMLFKAISTHKRLLKKGEQGGYVCEECREMEEDLERQEGGQYAAGHRYKMNISTEKYISVLLNPNKSWRPNVKCNKFRVIKNVSVDWDKIKEYIRGMDYYDFLKTPYWKAISEKVRKRANFRCQMCNSNNNLCVHHRSYENHGDEVHHLKDLICICKDCHTKYHFK